MKKLQRKIGFGLAMFASLVIISGCSTQQEETPNSTSISSSAVEKETEVKVSIALVKDENEYENKEVILPEQTDLMTGLKENFEIEEENGMIQGIDGLMQDTKENIYWTYTVNGEMAMTGAAETILADGDEVVFTYAKFE